MAEQSTFLSRSEKLEINDDKEVLSQKQQQQQFETTVFASQAPVTSD